MPAVHLIITGKVQGVFFRASAKEKADALGIKGWVKNTPHGDVEIMANGEQLAIEKFIDWCRKGPSKSRVVDVVVDEVDEGEFEGFRITR